MFCFVLDNLMGCVLKVGLCAVLKVCTYKYILLYICVPTYFFFIILFDIRGLQPPVIFF